MFLEPEFQPKDHIHHDIEAFLDWNQGSFSLSPTETTHLVLSLLFCAGFIIAAMSLKMNFTSVTDANEVMKRHVGTNLQCFGGFFWVKDDFGGSSPIIRG